MKQNEINGYNIDFRIDSGHKFSLYLNHYEIKVKEGLQNHKRSHSNIFEKYWRFIEKFGDKIPNYYKLCHIKLCIIFMWIKLSPDPEKYL